uniref:Uncharacterized protein n=1 Tax=Panagrolaimus davidi TaxID=227884 RepID=A0A914P6G5_9BILA
MKKSERKSKKAEEKVQIVREHFASPEPPILPKELSVENHLEITDPTTAKVPVYVQKRQQNIKKTSSAEPIPPKNNNQQQQQQYSAEPTFAKNQHHQQQTTPKPQSFVLPSSAEEEVKFKSEIPAITAKQIPPKSPANDSTDLRTPDWMKDPNEHKIRIS